MTVTIAGQTMTTLLQANGTWNATPTFVGEGTWTVVASVPDPAGNVGSATQTLTIVQVKPVSTAPPVISGAATVGTLLSVTTGGWSNNPTAYAYSWKRCTTVDLDSCTSISGATQATYRLTSADDTRYLRVLVTATNSGGSTTKYSYRTNQIKAAPPVNTAAPVISGTVKVGSVLSATTGTWDYSPTAYAYSWKRCTTADLASCASIAGATQATYTLTSADDLRYLRVLVTATNAMGSTAKYSARTAEITTPA